MGIGERRSPRRKHYDRRLEKALTAMRVSKQERIESRMLFSRLVRNDDPLPYQKAFSHVLEQLRSDRRQAARDRQHDPADTSPDRQ